MSTELPEPDRWEPDHHLVPSLLAGSPLVMADLKPPDRCWAVAGLGMEGLTAGQIADLLKCSLRLVREIRSEPMTAVAIYALTETVTWENERNLAASALRGAENELRAVVSDRDRLRDKMSRLLDAHITGTNSCRKCGMPWDKGNTYYNGDKRFCRNCNRIKQQNFRAQRREQRLSSVAGMFLGEALPATDEASAVDAEDGVALGAKRGVGGGGDSAGEQQEHRHHP